GQVPGVHGIESHQGCRHNRGRPLVTAGADTTGPRVGRRLTLLEGITVLDMTRFLAGPFAGMVLADLGADVLKVEQLTGDSTRSNPPYFFQGDSAYFLSVNRNKRSISLDLKSPEGREVLGR